MKTTKDLHPHTLAVCELLNALNELHKLVKNITKDKETHLYSDTIVLAVTEKVKALNTQGE
tara:strand:+ start:410 stop:592 length:183 start_codon:yes stop_codon:yes gene_type:complete